MSKKFYAAVFALIMSVSLSGCHLPILDKEVTMPFFEKKPDKVISLMMDKMQAVKTVKYKTDMTVKMHIDPSKMKINPLSFLNSSANPQVLGESVSVLDQNGLNDVEYGALPASDIGGNMDLPMFFEPGPMDVKYDISLSGVSDNSDKTDSKGETKFNLNFDLGGMEIKMDGEAKFIDQKIYFKIGQLPFPLSLMAGQFSNQWYELDLEKMQELQKEEMKKPGTEINLDDFDFTKNKEKLEKIEERFNMLIKDYELINFEKRLKDEKVDNNKCYRYQVSLNKNNLDNLIKEFIKIFKEEFIDGKNSEGIEQEIFNEVFNDPEFNSFLQKLSSIIKKAEGEIWIDKKDFYLRKAKFDLKMDFSGIEIEGEKVLAGGLSINVFGNLQYSDFNKPIKIEAPENTKSLINEIEKMMPKAIDNSSTDSYIDTDNDGLRDEDEIMIHKTDPSNPDTDGDGHSDGDEVMNGYNPNGEGKLQFVLKMSPGMNSEIDTEIIPISNIEIDDSFLIGLTPSEVYMKCYKFTQDLDSEKVISCASLSLIKELENDGGIDMLKQMLPMIKIIQPLNIEIISEEIKENNATIIVKGKDQMMGGQTEGIIKFLKENGIWKIEDEKYDSK